VAHDSTNAFPWSIGPARGWFGSASLSVSHRGLGGSGTSVTASGTMRGYVPTPWLRDHVLALLWAGALSRGDPGFEDVFGVGGFPRRDVFMDLVNRQTLHGQYLRGFAQNARVGNTFGLLNAEYRFPLAYVHRGLDTLPVAGRRVWATVFADAGGAWNGEPDWPDLRWDAGAELALSTSLFLVFDSTLRLGVARGFGDEGRTVFYFLLTP
jgi:outer membrane protein assembly factor BamA